METSEKGNSPNIGAMKKRRVVMADGRRYLIYYTFENNDKSANAIDVNSPAPEARNSIVEEKINV